MVTMKAYNISPNLIYKRHSATVHARKIAGLNNGTIGDWFRTTVGVAQGCLLSPKLFNTFLEKIISDALEHHEGTINIGGRPITNHRFSDDIDGLAGTQD